MNIAFIGYFNEQAVNGASKAAFDLAIGLKARNVNVFFYSAYVNTTTVSTLLNGQFVHRCFQKSLNPFRLSDDFKEFISANPDNIDLYHFHSAFIPFFIPLSKLIQLKGYPYVLTPHGGYAAGIINKNRLLKFLYLNLFEKAFIKGASQIICISETEVKSITQLASSIKPDVIPNAVELPADDGLSGISMPNKNLVYLGRYDIAHKGLDKLLHIFKIIEEADQRIKLNMHGEGKDKGKLHDLVKALKLKNVTVGSAVFGKDKAAVLKQGTAYIQASNWETFGIAVAEAMMLGKPVILNKACSLTQLLIKEKAGLIIDTEKPEYAASLILEYLSSEQKLAHDGKILKKASVASFSADLVSKATISLYHKILSKQVRLNNLLKENKFAC